MAVRAAYDALRDFGEQRFDPRPGTNQVANGAPLGPSNMIEFQHDGIRDSAVDARMLAEVSDYQRLISRTICDHTHAAAFIKRIDVLSMVSPRIAAPTLAANAVKAAGSFIAYAEFAFILDTAA